MKTLLRLLLLAVAVASSGCATLFVREVKTITINSDPSGAQVKDKSGKLFGATPYTFAPSKEDSYSFIIGKSGFEESRLDIKPVVNDGVLLADALLLCIPCIVDLPSKKYLEFPKSNYNVTLLPAATRGDNTETVMEDKVIYVNVEEPYIHFKNREVIGKLNGASKKYKSEEPEEFLGGNTFYTDGICNEFEKFNVRAIQCGLNRYAVGNSLVPPERQLYISAEVHSYNFDLKHKSKKFYGTGSIDVTWKVKDPTSEMKVIREKKTSVSGELEERQVKYAFREMFQRSARRFIAEDSLVDFLKQHVLLSPELMKGEIITLKKIGNPTFPKFKDLVSHCTRAVVTVKQKEGFGSGVVIASAGLIVTNYHVVDENKEVQVKLSTGISLTAKVIKTNPAADLALLKVEAQDLPALPFATGDLEIGEEVIAIGTPGDIALEQTVSKGIISGKRVFDGKKFLQTDLSVNPGNSGGPLIDEKGAIAGIITMKLMGRGMEGLGFALSTEEVIKGLNLKIE